MKYLINVDVDVFMRENRTYEIEANSEEEAKLNYKLNGKIVYEGEAQLDITIADDSTIGMSTKRINLPFEYTIDGIENAENNRIETFTEIGAQEFVSQNRSGGCEY